MSDSFLGQTILRKPTIIQTVRNERVIVRSLPAPGPPGPSGMIELLIDGGEPNTIFIDPLLIDGGNP